MKSRLLQIDRKKRWLVGGMIVAIILTGILTAWLLRPSSNLRSVSPDFKALTPNNSKPNWKQSKPEGSTTPVYIYTDTIHDVPIKVSEQPLPPSFRDDPASKIAEVAGGFNATNTMQVEGMTVYIGTSTKGPQSVLFSDGKLLVLIKSDLTISSGAWADYIKTLR